MNKYYFLLCSLPTIEIGVKPYVTFVELENYLKWNLSEQDKITLVKFREYLDIKNLKNLWMNRELDPRGNLDSKAIHELALREDLIPQYILDFMNKYPSVEERISNFSVIEIAFINGLLPEHHQAVTVVMLVV